MSSLDPTNFLSLVAVADKEATLNWSNFETPEKLFSYIADNFGIDPSSLDQIQKVYIGEVAPSLGSLWFNNGPIPFIGIPVGGEFVKIYQYPVNVPLVCLSQNQLINGLRQVTSSEATAWGLPVLGGTSFWGILDINLPATI